MKLRFLAALGSAIVLLAGCGAKADCPPGSSDAGASPPGSSDAGASPSPSASTEKPTYSFGLPTGDNSTDQRADSRIYVILDEGRCTEAQTVLDGLAPDFNTFEMPQEIILYQAAIYLCLDHTQDAKNTYALVTGNSKDYPSGWLGIGWHYNNALSWHICELYKSVTGVFEQRSGDSISCKYRLESERALSDYERFWRAPTDEAAPPNFARDDPRRHKVS